MKPIEILGKVNVAEMKKDSECLFFRWESLEVWRSKTKRGLFFEKHRRYERRNKLEISSPVLVYWNRITEEEASFALDVEAVNQGKIVIRNWHKTISRYRKSTVGRDFYWILRGKNNDRTVNYVLGGRGTANRIFDRLQQIKNLQENNSELYMFPRYADKTSWVFQMGGGAAFLGNLAKNNILQKVQLHVSEFRWEEEQLSIRMGAEDRAVLNGKQVKMYFLHDEITGELHRGRIQYDEEQNCFLLDNGFRNLLMRLYKERKKKYRIRVFPIAFSGEECTYYEFSGRGKRLYENAYDRQWRTEEYLDLMEDEGEKVALLPYYSLTGDLRFLVKQCYQLFEEICEGHLFSVKIKDNLLQIRFSLCKSAYSLKRVFLILRSGVQNKAYDFELTVKEKRKKILVEGVLPIQNVEWEQFYWDIRGIVTRDDREYELRLRNYSRLAKLKMIIQYRQVYLPDGKYLIFPYITNSYDLAVTYRVRTAQDNRIFVYREYVALLLYYLLKPYWHFRNIWLVYEKYSITAQDNSFYFFKYCMECLPEKEKKHIFYVIDKNADDYQYVKSYGKHVIQFLSLKHMVYLKAAALLISSDTKAHAYAWHSPNSIFREMIKRNRNVFLQHGVIYYKKCHQGLRRKGTNSCRLFIVSSDVEKKIVQDYFGYKANEIAVTGLARWDVLENRASTKEKMILMMPTWRSWLEEVTEEQFRASDYYKNYMALLNNSQLHDFLERKNVKMIFYIHPKFREYISAFATDCPNIQMIEFGTQPLNMLLMRCNMMVTDYSSACWDVFYQKKPVLFYVFDYDMYDRVQGSYVDIRTQAFGEATDRMDRLIELMEEYEANAFCENEKYAKMRKYLLPFRDHRNCERTYKIIRKKFYN